MAAEIPPMKPDILIMESTYGTHLHEKREEREARFTGTIHDIINRGGRCLIPVFALGRAQELLLGIHFSFDDNNDENFDSEMGQFDVINPHKAYS